MQILAHKVALAGQTVIPIEDDKKFSLAQSC